MSNQQSQQHQQQEQQLALAPSNQLGVSSMVLAGAQGMQIPAAALTAGQQGGLTAQQLTALAAASGVFIPGIPGAIRLPIAAPPLANMMLAPGLTFPATTAPAIQQQQQQPQVVPSSDASYRDYSRAPFEIDVSSSSANKEHSFPMKLHKILSDPEFSEYITFLPHGRAWRILKPKAFEEKVIPKFFRHAKYASFMRQVNGWGFKRMTRGPDHNSYYHELFLRGLPNLCLQMKRPSKTPPRTMGVVGVHPDFHTMNIYAPLPIQQLPAVAQTTLPVASTSPSDDNNNNNYSGSDASDRGVVSSSGTSYPATSDSDPNCTSSDSDRNGSSRDDSGGSDEGDRNSSEGDRNSRDETNEDISGSDPSAFGSDTERNSGSEGFESSSSPTTVGKKSSRKKRRHPRQELLDRADSSVARGSGGSESSERSSIRELNFLSTILSNRQADASSTVGDVAQDMATIVGPGGAALGRPAAVAAISGVGQQNAAASQSNATLSPTAPLTAANLSAVNQQVPGATANAPTAPLTAANLSAVNQLSGYPFPAPLTATNLSYLSLQNQLIQSQATIAQLLTYQQQMGLPPMSATGVSPQPPTAPNPGDQGRQQG